MNRRLTNKKKTTYKLNKLYFLYLLNRKLRCLNSLKRTNRFIDKLYFRTLTKNDEIQKWANYIEKEKHANKFLISARNKTKIKKTNSYLKLKSLKSFKRYDFSIKRRFGFKRIFVFFRLDEKPMYKRRRKLNLKKKLYLYNRRVRFFYGGLTPRGQWRLSRLLRKKKKKVEFDNKIISLENRLNTLLYRVNLVKWPSVGSLLVKKGLVLVNKKTIRSTAYLVKPYDIVALKNKHLRNDFLLKLNNSRVQNIGFKGMPNFLEFNYKAFCFTYIPQLYMFNMLNFKFPIKKQLIFGLGKKTI